jgi:hypothetical protein
MTKATNATLVDIETLLSPEEADFVKMVYANPGCKISSVMHYVDDGSEYGTSKALYKLPEELGLIECVGSYKWIPKNLIMKLFKS